MVGDILAGTQLEAHCYHRFTEQLLSLDRPMAVILEGGYGPELIAEASLNVVHALLGRPPPPKCASVKAAVADAGASLKPGGNIVVQHLLDAIRRKLNGLPPWKQLQRPDGEPYFLESAGGEDSS